MKTEVPHSFLPPYLLCCSVYGEDGLCSGLRFKQETRELFWIHQAHSWIKDIEIVFFPASLTQMMLFSSFFPSIYNFSIENCLPIELFGLGCFFFISKDILHINISDTDSWKRFSFFLSVGCVLHPLIVSCCLLTETFQFNELQFVSFCYYFLFIKSLLEPRFFSISPVLLLLLYNSSFIVVWLFFFWGGGGSGHKG